MTKEQTKHVEELIAKAAKCSDSADAMRFSQAALNVVNAVLTLSAIQPTT